MSPPDLQTFSSTVNQGAEPFFPWVIFLSSYMSGALEGKRLGTPGYSYDFVARLFAPLLERLGKLVEVKWSSTELSGLIRSVRQEGREPIVVTFRPFQDAFLAPLARNVVVPAWEFPDIPDSPFDANPQNNWIQTANRCALVLVGGPFTADALQAAGVTTPIRVVPVPTPEPYFHLPRWQSDCRVTLRCLPYIFEAIDRASSGDNGPHAKPRWRETLRLLARPVYRRVVKRWLPRRIKPVVTAVLRTAISSWREQSLPPPSAEGLDLDGIVYTSILNPKDGRKNWEDMITAFLYALRDCDDATLVLKLISSEPQEIHRVISFYHRLDVPHRCRLVLIPDFLSDAGMLELARVSTYYLTTTRAEGNCLPLMNYLAAGRPGISPVHTAISDYFDSRLGFVVESHPEPAAWPQDSRLRWRTTWHRLVWTSLVEQLRRSYQVAKHDQAAYRVMAAAGREKMRQWAHPDAVWHMLESAMQVLRADEEPLRDSAFFPEAREEARGPQRLVLHG